MLLYGCFNIDSSGPLIQYLKTFQKFSCVAELQPLRNQSHIELSPNVWGQNSVIDNECTEKYSKMYFVIFK